MIGDKKTARRQASRFCKTSLLFHQNGRKAAGIQQRAQVIRRRRRKGKAPPGNRMGKGNSLAVQRLPPNQAGIPSIERVPQKRMTGGCTVGADLVHPSGEQAAAQQGAVPVRAVSQRRILGHCRKPTRKDSLLRLIGDLPAERKIHSPAACDPAVGDGKVALFDVPPELRCGQLMLRRNQSAAGVFIQPVHRPKHPFGGIFQRIIAVGAGAVADHSGRLVVNGQVLILIEDPEPRR